MKRPIASAIAALCILSASAPVLGGCKTLTPASATVTEGKAIAGAWSTLKFAAEAADVWALSGQASPAQAATVSADIHKATAALKAADELYAKNHNADVSAQIAEGVSLAAAILTIVHPAK